ncbi:hypothetical protein BJ878DRAFT_194429 [Calycina marina]|uniref:BZIP domain-containing protein n=1 Tax=Calycina marina TaxID=1763456 RepID=A0A9P7Z878_9HELO|nr:hypothetical protein BJ878DRAFT_194429 [Calycina marina]
MPATMATQTTTFHSKYILSTKMNPTADKDERKREYNRLAQRDFRRRRKDHLRNLEQAQKEQNNEQSEEIERLRCHNDELRRENEALRAQIYGSNQSGTSSIVPMSAPLHLPFDGRQYSVSPSVSAASSSGTCSPPASVSSDMMPLTAMSMTSSVIPHSYSDPAGLASQPYSMVHMSGFRHNSQSSLGSSGFRNAPTAAMGPSFQSLSIPQPAESQPQATDQRRNSSRSSSTVLTPFERKEAGRQILSMFPSLFQDSSITMSSEQHLATLRSISDTLPDVLKPTDLQLATPHSIGIDLIPSPSLRERLLRVTSDVAQRFLHESGINAENGDDLGHLMIWGDDALNEMSWEFSEWVLQRWRWLLGRKTVSRTNYWRSQRGVRALPDW